MKKSTLVILLVVVAFALGLADPVVQGVKQAGHQASSIVCKGGR